MNDVTLYLNFVKKKKLAEQAGLQLDGGGGEPEDVRAGASNSSSPGASSASWPPLKGPG